MKKIIILILMVLLIPENILLAKAPSGEEILKRIDENYKAENIISTSSMIIRGRRGIRKIKVKSWRQGQDKSFTEYLAPAREKGTKMLKLKDELWTYSPYTDRTIKIAGHMLRQSLLGSDVSYEDFMEDPVLSNVYDVKIIGEEKINDRLCYVLKLAAKKEEVAYYSRKLWVDKEHYLPLKEDLFAKSGKLLKTIQINKVFKVGKRWYPRKITFKDFLKKGKGTEFIIDSIKFDVKIPEYIFTKAALRR